MADATPRRRGRSPTGVIAPPTIAAWVRAERVDAPLDVVGCDPAVPVDAHDDVATRHARARR